MEFDNEFVRFMPDNELIGKEVIYADHITDLKERVLRYVSGNDEHFLDIVTDTHEAEFPFVVNGSVWKFVYYDPYLELKKAYKQGKVIELYEESDGTWDTLEEEPNWYFDPSFYRIKPEEDYATHRELAKWVADGYGQVLQEDNVYTQFVYDITNDNKEVSKDCLVRAWGDTQWCAVTKEYLEAWS